MKKKINEAQLTKIVAESVKKVLRENDEQEQNLFMQVFEYFQEKYHHRNLDMKGSLVYIDGELKFNIDGYNLLYNLQRLCKALDDELL